MLRNLLFVVLVLTAGCSSGEGAVYLTIGSDRAIGGIDHFRVAAMNANMESMPGDVPLSGAPVAIPPPIGIQVRFPKGRSGSVSIHVDAVDHGGYVLASGDATANLLSGKETNTEVILRAATLPVDGGVDMAAADLAQAAPDLAINALPDLASPVPDLAMNNATPDLFNPAPNVSAVTPKQGPTTGALTLSISGSGFAAGATVMLGGAPASNVNVVSPTRLTCTLPSDSGARGFVDVQVTNTDGLTGKLSGGFYYYPGTVAFGVPSTYATTIYPGAVSVCDLNGDGHPDVVAANLGGPNVAVLPAKGGGLLGAAQIVTVGAALGRARCFDVDGDGLNDVVAMDGSGSGSVLVLLGKGDGTFKPPLSLPGQSHSTSDFVIGDFTGDGRLDLASIGPFYGPNSGFIYWKNQGAGSFQPSGTLDGTIQSYVALAMDENLDGKLDVLLLDSTAPRYWVADGNGDGTFQPPQAIPIALAKPVDFCEGRFTNASVNSKRASLAFAEASTNSVLVDTFGAAQATALVDIDAGNVAILAADVNLDGVDDLIAINGATGGARDLTFNLSNGDGTFQTKQPFAQGTAAIDAALADMDGDGLVDVVTANWLAGSVSVILNASR